MKRSRSTSLKPFVVAQTVRVRNSTPAAAMPRPYRKHSRVDADDGNEDFWTFAPRRPLKILMDNDDTSGRNRSALTSGGGGGDQSVLPPLASSSHELFFEAFPLQKTVKSSSDGHAHLRNRSGVVELVGREPWIIARVENGVTKFSPQRQ